MTDDDERPPMREMRSAECWERIAQAPYGRVGTVAAGEMDIFPVNHGVDRYSIVFRSAPGTKLLAMTIHRRVVFEVDGIDGDEVFSVVVKGDADELEDEREVREAERLGVSTWAPGRKDRWVRISPRDIQGRSFTLPSPLGQEPSGATEHP